MKAFLSHSSEDRQIVDRVLDELGASTVWLDRAELRVGDEFPQQIEQAIENATHFVLFWSESSAASPWVRLELNMAFTQLLEQNAIRLVLVQLDETTIPTRLKHLHIISVASSANPLQDILSALRDALSIPSQGARHRFLNRGSELERMEEAIDDPEANVVVLRGIQGIGKGALAREALRRFFENASVVDVLVQPGMGPNELALRLHQEVTGRLLPPMNRLEALSTIETTLEQLITSGRFIIFRNVQIWVDGDQNLEEPLATILRTSTAQESRLHNPVILTTTRILHIAPPSVQRVAFVNVSGLSDQHMESLLGLWYELAEGKVLPAGEAATIAKQLHGHPIAAKMASTLVTQYGSAYLVQYDRAIVSLRRDLTKAIMRDLRLSTPAQKLMEMLALLRVPIPSTVLADTLQLTEDEFHTAVGDATSTGLAEVTLSGQLTLHPLVADYFWRSYSNRADYGASASIAAEAVRNHVEVTAADAAQFVELLTAVVRLYALAGEVTKAQEFRSDLLGQLAEAAITHYQRMKLGLAEQCIREVLSVDARDWEMRLYLARIRVRQQKWGDASELTASLLSERPGDTRARHLQGWQLLRRKSYREALNVFVDILAERQHVQSYRDAAECLFRLGDVAESLGLLDQAKQIESDNPFVLALESRILEENGDYDRALQAVNLALVRNPADWELHHRRARILGALGRPADAIREAEAAVGIDPARFTSRSTLVSLLIEESAWERVALELVELNSIAVNSQERQIAGHLEARVKLGSGDLRGARKILEDQTRRGVNLAASYGLLAQIHMAEFELVNDKGSARARLKLQQTRSALEKCEAQPDHDPQMNEGLRRKIENYEARGPRP